MESAFSDKGTLAAYNLTDLAGCGANADRICLTTLHSSKGRQFDVVIMPGLEEGRLPSYSATSVEALREARRTFYVGFTRARELVYLLYSGWYQFRQHTFRKGPSRFVLELQEALVRQK
jgi:DNA helicase II / ATP-dependent DNA helicase PcrA